MGKLPGRLRKSLTDEQAQDAKFTRCPKGHALPHRTNKGLCTPIYCAGSTPGKPVRAPASYGPRVPASPRPGALARAADPEFTDLAVAETGGIVERKIAEAHTRHEARQRYLKVPKFKDDEARSQWIEAKKKELVPLAIGDVEYSLKLGDQPEREKARREILDMTGHLKKEAAGGGEKPMIIIMNGPGNVGQNPWVRRIDSHGKELPAETVDAKK